MPGVPDRSSEQREEALKRANFIRSFRKELKEDLKAGRTTPYDYILDPPEPIRTMKLLDILLAVPKYGKVKTNRVLVQTRISPAKTIGGLSERQKAEIVSKLRN